MIVPKSVGSSLSFAGVGMMLAATVGLAQAQPATPIPIPPPQ